MSVDFNSVINQALSNAQARRNAASSTVNGLVNSGNMDYSAKSTAGSALTMEDIAAGMKASKSKKNEDSDFILNHGISKRAEKEACAPAEIGLVNDKISSAHHNAEKALARQIEVSNSLRDIRNDPFTT